MGPHPSRRGVIEAFGSASATSCLAGCSSLSGDTGSENEVSAHDDPDAGDKWSEIRLLAEESGWIGVEPERIEDERNPTLVLEAGAEYELHWENGDGSQHNIAIRSGNMATVDDYVTEFLGQPGESQTLVFTASTEMDFYICEPHIDSMVGEIAVRDSE